MRLPVTVAADGEVSVGPEPIGHLTGFDFRVDPSARLADKRLLLAAAERRLGEELDRRAKSLIEAPDEAFELLIDEDGRPGGRLAGQCPGAPRARPLAARARAAHQPARSTSCRRRRRAELRGRLEAWLDAQVDRNLARAQEACRGRYRPVELARRPRPRGDARPTPAGCLTAPRPGGVDRRARAGRPSDAAQARRSPRPARRLRARPCSSRPPSSGARRCSRGAYEPCRCRHCPRPAQPSLDAEADARGAALAYRRLGRQWLRIDLADRLASHAHKVRSAGGDEPVDVALATSVGLDEAGIAKLMEEVGFTRAGEAWRWRGRRPPRAERRAPGPHAFAELAKLSA